MVMFYNCPGTAEQWIKEGKNAVNRAQLSCHGFATNAAPPPGRSVRIA